MRTSRRLPPSAATMRAARSWGQGSCQLGAEQAHGDQAADPDGQAARTVGLSEQHDVVTGGVADAAHVGNADVEELVLDGGRHGDAPWPQGGWRAAQIEAASRRPHPASLLENSPPSLRTDNRRRVTRITLRAIPHNRSYVNQPPPCRLRCGRDLSGVICRAQRCCPGERRVLSVDDARLCHSEVQRCVSNARALAAG
jgi:hypothetical protein